MKHSDIDDFFIILAKIYPFAKSELTFHNPFTLLVAVVLSAQATDKSVNKATANFFKEIDTPEKMLAMGTDALYAIIKPIGLAHTKTKNILALSHHLIDRFNSIVPGTLNELMTLPGVGRKTANVVLNCAFDQPTIAVDTHVFRVANRTGLASGKTPRAIEDILSTIVPKAYRLQAHHWLILHGRRICKARKPDCEICPVRHLCDYYKTLK